MLQSALRPIKCALLSSLFWPTRTTRHHLKNKNNYVNFVCRNIAFSAQLCNKTITASFEEVRMAKDNHNVLLIDVREAQELQETGMIPGSINISLKKIEDVLKNMSVKDFQEQYGRNKPNANFPIIFSCKAGIRSKQAQDIAIKLGYTDTKNYEGGWLDWVEKNK